MARRLQLRDVVPQQNLHGWLDMEKCLNDQFTHEHSQSILHRSNIQSTNLHRHHAIIPTHSCFGYVLRSRLQVVAQQSLNFPQNFLEPTHTMMKYHKMTSTLDSQWESAQQACGALGCIHAPLEHNVYTIIEASNVHTIFEYCEFI